MKKLVLALLIALGVANANVVANTNVLSQDILALDIDSTEKKNILEWVKAHPVLATTIAAAAVTAIYGATDQLVNKGAHRQAACNFVSEKATACRTKISNGFTSVKDAVMSPKESAKAAYNNTIELVKAHPYYTAGSIVALVVATYAIYDLAQKDNSKIKKSYDKIKRIFEKKEAVA